jgi:hypothetical protein
MKKRALTIIIAGVFVFTVTSCNNKRQGNMDSTDTTTVPAETTVPAGGKDTIATPPVAPGVDTGMNQTPKI